MSQKPIKSKRNKLFDDGLDFFDEIGEAFTPPEFIKLPKPKSMLELRMEIIHNMRNHFRKALAELGLNDDNSVSNQGKKTKDTG